jgi:hypothetical protein
VRRSRCRGRNRWAGRRSATASAMTERRLSVAIENAVGISLAGSRTASGQFRCQSAPLPGPHPIQRPS